MGGHVNFMSVLIGAVAAFVFSGFYTFLLARAAVKANGKVWEECQAEQRAKSGPARAAPFIIAFVANLIVGVVIYGILTHSGLWSLRAGMITGAFCWFGFVLTSMAVNNALSGRKVMLTVIDGGNWLGVLLIIGGIIGAFGP